MEEFHDAPASEIPCKADTPQRLGTPIWRKEIAIPIVLGNVLGLYWSSGLSLEAAAFFFQLDKMLLLVFPMAWLYLWYRHISRRSNTTNLDWLEACLGGIHFGLLTAFMHLLTKVRPCVDVDNPEALLDLSPDVFGRVMDPRLSILSDYLNLETFLVFFATCLCGALLFHVLPRRFSALSIGVVLLIVYLLAGQSILLASEYNPDTFSGQLAERHAHWRLGLLAVGLGNGLAILLLWATELLNSWKACRFFGRYQRSIQKRLSGRTGSIFKEESTDESEQSGIGILVMWGWVLGIIVTYNFRIAMFLPTFVMGGFVLTIIAILLQLAIVRRFLTHDKKSIPYRVVSFLGAQALGAAYVTIFHMIYDGLSSQMFFTYRLDAATTTQAGVALFVFGLLLGALLLTRLNKNKALLVYGLCMFIPACIAVFPPVMAFYIGPGSFVGLVYCLYLPILYLPVGFGLACIVVGIHNMRQERRIRKRSATN